MNKVDYVKIIKEKLKIVDVIGKDCNLIRSGNNFKALCPFHKEKTPSFVVNDIKDTYNCFGCGKSGDIFTYIMEKNNLDFKEALKFLASMANLDLDSKNFVHKSYTRNEEKKYFEIMQHISNYYKNNLYQYLSTNKLEILEKKKIDKNEIEKFSLGLSTNSYELEKYLRKYSIEARNLLDLGIFKQSENKSKFDLFKNRLMFPIKDKFDRVIAFGGRILEGEGPKYINSWENDYFKKRKVLYNLNGLKGLNNRNENIFLVEGYTDVIALSKTKNYAVAPLGTSISIDQINLLWKYVNEPTVFLDGDVAGKMAVRRLIDTVLPKLDVENSLNFVLVNDKMDPDDIINSEGGNDKLLNITENKISLLETLMILEKKIDLNSPERLLGYKKRLFNKINTIENEEIRKLYIVFLQKRLNEEFNKSMYSIQNKYHQSKDSYFLKLSKGKSKDRFVLRRERSIVVAMINNFRLLQDYDEKLALIPLSNLELSKIRDMIIQIISTNKINSSMDLKKLLIEKNFSDLLKKHFPTTDCINYNLVEKYAKETTDIGEARKALIDLINIQQKWYYEQNKNLSNNFLKL